MPYRQLASDYRDEQNAHTAAKKTAERESGIG